MEDVYNLDLVLIEGARPSSSSSFFLPLRLYVLRKLAPVKEHPLGTKQKSGCYCNLVGFLSTQLEAIDTSGDCKANRTTENIIKADSVYLNASFEPP